MGTKIVFLMIGLGCFLAAGYLALTPRVIEQRIVASQAHGGGPVTRSEEPHPASWGASEGFAVAGGLCVVAAGLAHRRTDED